jgi:hypothetical protein
VTWHAWLWSRQGWHCAGSADSLAEAARLLEAEGAKRGVLPHHQLITGSSEPPAFTPPPRKRCRKGTTRTAAVPAATHQVPSDATKGIEAASESPEKSLP